jgi:hypothetical protein
MRYRAVDRIHRHEGAGDRRFAHVTPRPRLGVLQLIHDTPKRSAPMPKREEMKVFANGICTCPPSVNRAAGKCPS